MALFGIAGADDRFYEENNKRSVQIPAYLNKYGLDAFEYQCSKGVNVSDQTAMEIGVEAKKYNIFFSIHAPYFISLSSVDEQKRNNSINYILQSAQAAKMMGAKRIVIHSGSTAKLDRSVALQLAKDTLKKALDAMDERGYDSILCPEVMGVTNQLGTLDEVMELCKIDERLIPTIDFGHLNARTFGSLKSYEDFEKVIDTIGDKLGSYRQKNFHSHFSKIEYNMTAGERRHLTFEDRQFGPDFEPLCELIYKKNLTPVIICESAGTQGIDAKNMKDYYNKLKGI